MAEWELHGPYSAGAYTIHGPQGERLLIEIADEPRDSERTKVLAEAILYHLKERLAA